MRASRFEKLGPSQQIQLSAWFQRHLGRVLAEQEQKQLEKWVAGLFGYYLIQVGLPVPDLELLSGSPAKNKVLLDARLDGVDLRADPLQLPLATDSVDAVLMHHALDFSPDPHQLLREVERILIPEGKLLVVGFNPLSLWGVWRLVHLRGTLSPWTGHFFSVKRVSDWLSLLGFNLQAVDYLNFRPPLQNQAIMQRLAFMERLGQKNWPVLGGVYVLVAVKRTLTMTPIKPKWAIRKKVLPAAVEPTTRTHY